MSVRSLVRLAAALLLVLSSIPSRAADPAPAPAAAEKGDLWEVTSKMSMEGMDMPMPVQKLKICSPKTWTQPPAPENERQKCTNSDFQMNGAKATWKITCEPPHPMTGTGEITRNGADAYIGVMKFSSAEGNMTMQLDGHRAGECDHPRK